ncbi:hypothetical protein NSE_0364 [Neorickettsia sennetsu str. Miyayama]|uniref:Uncharacterized protein n=1 Tax=Ehrlichia sennetsu (strain ATCC VR-367 / Miyayama) TaxID=222891 RepID=Q2GE43_EHRS3|nr:hypothetical protein NSE_0364 [Neorickettsia sennetsu str. Miyayama]
MDDLRRNFSFFGMGQALFSDKYAILLKMQLNTYKFLYKSF